MNAKRIPTKKNKDNLSNIEKLANRIRRELFKLEDNDFKNKIKKYFKEGDYIGLGISNGLVYQTIHTIQKNNPDYLHPKIAIGVSENLLLNAKYSEEKIAAFNLLAKVAKNLEPEFLSRFQYWLENYVATWAECDVLCLKTIYNFFLNYTKLIPLLKQWARSDSIWCRRASNVVMIKFLNRKIKEDLYYKLDKKIIFDNCLKLSSDKDFYVQKSIGWLLKEASVIYPDDVKKFLMDNSKNIIKPTLKTAIKKMNKSNQKLIMNIYDR